MGGHANYHTTYNLTTAGCFLRNLKKLKKLHVFWRYRERTGEVGLGAHRVSAHLLLICGATGVTQDIPLEV